MSERRPTDIQYLQALEKVFLDHEGHSALESMLRARISLPTITNAAAVILFRKGDCNSELAKVIRQQIAALEDHGHFDFADADGI